MQMLEYQTDFADLALRALPCPFCGKRLAVKSDHHGDWIAHRDENGSCLAVVFQIHGEDDLTDWNRRATLTDGQLRDRLFEVGKPSLREWCRVHGVNNAHANEFATGIRGPGADLLRALGMTKAYTSATPSDPGASDAT